MSKTLMIFSSPNCAPCGPTKEAAQNADLGGAELRIVDVEEHPEIAMRHGARSLPTLIVTDASGDPLAQHVGALSQSGIEALVARA